MGGLCSGLIFGLVVGVIARAITPGEQRMGLLKTSLLGVAGSFMGGLLGSLLLGRNPLVLHPSGWIGSMIGAVVLMMLARWVSGR